MTTTMLAGRLNLRTRAFAVERVPVPDPGPGQVRIKVMAAGICLSDVHLIEGSLNPLFNPSEKVTLGHEVSGVIDAIGPGVPPVWKTGQRVLLQAGERCGVCPGCVRGAACLQVRTRGVDYDGGWAEYALATHYTLVPIPDDLPFEQAAIIPDAVSTPWAAIVATGQARPAYPAGVWGVGGLGAHAVQLLRAIGAAPIIAIDPLEPARTRALEFGADLALDAMAPDVRERIKAITGGRMLDVAFDMAGVAPVREQALRCLGPGGRLVLVGLTPAPLTIGDSIGFSYRQQKLLGHYGSEPEHVEQLVNLARGHRLDFARSISGLVPLADAADGVERLRQKHGNPIRLILKP
ncbi:alcohol dehydrogenase catalytic domain-containing protein [Pyxidicoccus fallax]|uniref:Alcohol dehydrogenase catalytic domain-containing protein n=1 Tax=Pyxidicoccus fallax TaxID=394095 RepID=A0A848LS64_9BACT|nr:zinc-binding dehydrogenase [Pyxidicoccus fallax]NMO20531.1 alcohol dehydrogenase catalytic domain-containing protein [Pyxidicoccus fallax]NPC82096.1 alcohol dehydrogenase catalytic domain-containing protein [Pyxidicoccus fallax]